MKMFEKYGREKIRKDYIFDSLSSYLLNFSKEINYKDALEILKFCNSVNYINLFLFQFFERIFISAINNHKESGM